MSTFASRRTGQIHTKTNNLTTSCSDKQTQIIIIIIILIIRVILVQIVITVVIIIVIILLLLLILIIVVTYHCFQRRFKFVPTSVQVVYVYVEFCPVLLLAGVLFIRGATPNPPNNIVPTNIA